MGCSGCSQRYRSRTTGASSRSVRSSRVRATGINSRGFHRGVRRKASLAEKAQQLTEEHRKTLPHVAQESASEDTDTEKE